MANSLIKNVLCLSSVACCLFAASPTKLPDLEIGQNLQVSTQIILTEPAPEQGLEIRISSEDPHRLLLAKAPDAAGSGSVVIKIHPKSQQSPEFWLQAFAGEGEVSYTAVNGDLQSWQGTVRLYPSAIAISGPYKGTFTTTPRAFPATISVSTARLDSSGQLAEPQLLAGGRKLSVPMRVSDPSVGKVEPGELVINGGTATTTALFRPAGPGSARIEPAIAEPWRTPTELTHVTANVVLPGIMVTDDGTAIGESTLR